MWLTFIKERFPLREHLLLLSFFFFANALLITKHFSLATGLCFLAVVLTFFHMRLFDEIKDYAIDCKIHKERPLARGLISVSHAKKTAFFLIFLELLISRLISTPSFVAMGLVALYTLLMYNEFFLSKFLQDKLATYALSHTLVVCLICLFIFSSVTNQFIFAAPKEYLLFMFANWMIFNIFEFGRKTFGKEEEKESVDSYSKNFGPFLAKLYVVLMALCAVLIAFYEGRHFHLPSFFYILMLLLFTSLTIPAWVYGKSYSALWAKRYRKACALFILFFNVIMVIGFLCIT